MPFKPHLAALVLLLCGLLLIESKGQNKDESTTHPITRDKEAQTSLDKTTPDCQPTSDTQQTKDRSMVTSTIQHTNKDKTDQPTVKKTTQLAEKNRHESGRPTLAHNPDSQHTPTSSSQHRESPATREAAIIHKGGSSATIPSLFTIVSLMCVFLL